MEILITILQLAAFITYAAAFTLPWTLVDLAFGFLAFAGFLKTIKKS